MKVNLKLILLNLNLKNFNQLVGFKFPLTEKPTDETDTLLQCLDSLKLELDSRKSTIDHLGQVLTTDLLMTVDNSQVKNSLITKYFRILNKNSL